VEVLTREREEYWHLHSSQLSIVIMSISSEDDFTLQVEQVADFRVTIQGKRGYGAKLGAILTIHDIGMNCESYMNFFNKKYNEQLLEKFVVYHIEVPGQHVDAERLPNDYEFLPLSKMADRMIAVLERYSLRDVIGLGVGAGAVLLIQLAMAAPQKFLGITVIDPASKSLGFKEWGEQKLAAWQLEKRGFTSNVEKFLVWHLFGTKGKKKISLELLDQVLADVTNHQNAYNLAQYVKSYQERTDFMVKVGNKLKCHVLIITSVHSPYKEEAYRMHSKLNKERSSIIESNNSINAFFEDPDKCGEGMLLLMQGVGLVPTLRTRTECGGNVQHTASTVFENPFFTM